MSRRNGDKSKFNRLRKEKIQRRERLREILKALRAKAPEPVGAAGEGAAAVRL